jgi:hypothetical protein
MRHLLCALAALFCVFAADNAYGVEPLGAEVQTEDARRFAEVFLAADGRPTAAQLQRGYLDGAGRGVEVFTPGRIRNAERLARVVAANPDKYRRAIEVCLPAAEAATADLRSVYLGLAGLFPGRDLPEVHAVFGAGNSGGTAAPGIQVLGLEVICELAADAEDLRRTLRGFFAHETVHALQPQLSEEVISRDPLLAFSLQEGFADYVASLILAGPPTPSRDAWAREREAQLWAEFQRDRAILSEEMRAGGNLQNPSPAAQAAYTRWLSNYRAAPEGWPHEMGYWIGRRIIEAYMARASDRRAAFEAVLRLEDPEAILSASGYGR